MPDLKRHVVTAAPWAALESAVVAFAGLASTALLARLLPAEDFGSASVALSLTALIELGLSALFVDALIQKRRLRRVHVETAFWTISVTGGVLLALLALAADAIGGVYEDPRLGTLLPVACLATFTVVLAVTPSIMLTRRLRTRAMALRNSAVRLAGIAVSVVLALAGFGVWSLMLSALLSSTLGALLLWRSYRKRPRLLFSFAALKELMRFGIPAAGENLIWQVGTRVFFALTGYIHGIAALGHLSLAFRLTDSLTGLFTSLTGRLALPLFATIQHDRARMRAAFLRGSEYLGLIVAPAFALVALQADDVVLILFGPGWESAIPVLRLMCWIELALFLRILVSPFLKALNRPAPLLPASALALLVLVGAVLLSGDADLFTTTLSWLARPLLVLPFGLVLVRLLGGAGLTAQLLALRLPLAGLLALAAAVTLAQSSAEAWAPAGRVALASTAGLLAYLASIVLLDRNGIGRDLGRLARRALAR